MPWPTKIVTSPIEDRFFLIRFLCHETRLERTGVLGEAKHKGYKYWYKFIYDMSASEQQITPLIRGQIGVIKKFSYAAASVILRLSYRPHRQSPSTLSRVNNRGLVYRCHLRGGQLTVTDVSAK